VGIKKEEVYEIQQRGGFERHGSTIPVIGKGMAHLRA